LTLGQKSPTLNTLTPLPGPRLPDALSDYETGKSWAKLLTTGILVTSILEEV
jgi:hypothetical protein